MIVLVHLLERGNDYVLFTIKGAELQETTVCHAEENEHINSVTEALFENDSKSKCNMEFAFSLSTIRQVQFSLYDDNKYSLSGTIENPDFANLMKNYFTRVFAYKL